MDGLPLSLLVDVQQHHTKINEQKSPINPHEVDIIVQDCWIIHNQTNFFKIIFDAQVSANENFFRLYLVCGMRFAYFWYHCHAELPEPWTATPYELVSSLVQCLSVFASSFKICLVLCPTQRT